MNEEKILTQQMWMVYREVLTEPDAVLHNCSVVVYIILIFSLDEEFLL